MVMWCVMFLLHSSRSQIQFWSQKVCAVVLCIIWVFIWALHFLLPSQKCDWLYTVSAIRSSGSLSESEIKDKKKKKKKMCPFPMSIFSGCLVGVKILLNSGISANTYHIWHLRSSTWKYKAHLSFLLLLFGKIKKKTTTTIVCLLFISVFGFISNCLVQLIYLGKIPSVPCATSCTQVFPVSP